VIAARHDSIGDVSYGGLLGSSFSTFDFCSSKVFTGGERLAVDA
jgi:hypothetical protein